MIELGEPLHAFDYDILKERAGNKKIKIITRTAQDGEELVTLDGVKRKLTSMNVLVCDEKGSLSLAGVMGGSESEVYDASKEVLDVKGIETKPGEMVAGKNYLAAEKARSMSCSKARGGTSSTSAAQPNSTTFHPKHRSAFHAVYIQQLQKLESSADFNTWRHGLAVQ